MGGHNGHDLREARPPLIYTGVAVQGVAPVLVLSVFAVPSISGYEGKRVWIVNPGVLHRRRAVPVIIVAAFKLKAGASKNRSLGRNLIHH